MLCKNVVALKTTHFVRLRQTVMDFKQHESSHFIRANAKAINICILLSGCNKY